jgi:hypothetical protein
MSKMNIFVLFISMVFSGAVMASGVTNFEYYSDAPSIFDNGEAHDFFEWTTYGSVTLTLDSSDSYDGDYSLKMEYDNSADPYESRASVSLWDPGNDGKRVDYYESLNIAFKVTDESGYLQAALVDMWGNNVAFVKYDDVNKTPAGDWKVWEIDIDQLTLESGTDLNNIGRIDLWMNEYWDDTNSVGTDFGSGVVYFDTIAFISDTESAEKVLEWKLDNDTNDSSGHNNDGVYNGTPSYVDGYYNECIELDGSSHSSAKVQIDDPCDLPLGGGENWSMNIWVNPANDISSGGDYHGLGIAGFGDPSRYDAAGMARYIHNWGWGSGIAFYSCGMRGMSSGVPYDVGKWQMVTVTYNHNLWYMNIWGGTSKTNQGDSLKIYKNGALIGSFNPQGTSYNGGFYPVDYEYDSLNSVRATILDITHDHPGNCYQGKIDDFTIWTGVLSPQEIASLTMQGDYDKDNDVDYNDLYVQIDYWLDDYNTTEDTNLPLEDFESYVQVPGEPNILDSFICGSLSTLSLNTGTDQSMRWTYDTSPATESVYAGMDYFLDGTIDLCKYDQLRIKLYRHTGNSDEELVYLKFQNSDYETMAEAWITHDIGSTSSPAGVWDEWVIDLHDLEYPSWSVDTSKYSSLADIRGVHSIMLGCGHAADTYGGGTGTIDIDDIVLVDFAGCTVAPKADLNGDCTVNFDDFAIFAEDWFVGTE